MLALAVELHQLAFESSPFRARRCQTLSCNRSFGRDHRTLTPEQTGGQADHG